MNAETRDLWGIDGNISSIIKFFRENKKINISQMVDKHMGATFYIDNVYIDNVYIDNVYIDNVYIDNVYIDNVYIDNDYNVRGVSVVISRINRGIQFIQMMKCF